MIKTYKCWKDLCKKHKDKYRLKEEELVKEKQDSIHTDYKCPECGSVIICKVSEKKKK